MTEPLLPIDIRNWMDDNNWSVHHTNWHFSRLWEVVPQMNAWVISHDGQRAAIQEGVPGNGIEFLAMHRVMIRTIGAAFPQMEPLFGAWVDVPQDPDDPEELMPNNGENRDFDTNYSAAVSRIRNHLDSFQSEDELGLFLQTSRRPQPGDPMAISSDKQAGLHSYLHLRLGYPITNPEEFEFGMRNHHQNFKNERFWHLHGWIDRVWDAYRKLRNISTYSAELEEAAREMQLHANHAHRVQPPPPIDVFALEMSHRRDKETKR